MANSRSRTAPRARRLRRFTSSPTFAWPNGTVKFHKDGYTDLRGKFDYATVSTPETSPIVKYAILVLSETQGALIREANPPQQ